MPELLARELLHMIEKVAASMLALGLHVVVGRQVPLLCQAYIAQQEHIGTEICPDSYRSRSEHVLVYLKPWMVLLLPLAYMTKHMSSKCMQACCPTTLYIARQNVRTGIADCVFRAELLCLSVVQ